MELSQGVEDYAIIPKKLVPDAPVDFEGQREYPISDLMLYLNRKLT